MHRSRPKSHQGLLAIVNAFHLCPIFVKPVMHTGGIRLQPQFAWLDTSAHYEHHRHLTSRSHINFIGSRFGRLVAASVRTAEPSGTCS